MLNKAFTKLMDHPDPDSGNDYIFNKHDDTNENLINNRIGDLDYFHSHPDMNVYYFTNIEREFILSNGDFFIPIRKKNIVDKGKVGIWKVVYYNLYANQKLLISRILDNLEHYTINLSEEDRSIIRDRLSLFFRKNKPTKSLSVRIVNFIPEDVIRYTGEVETPLVVKDIDKLTSERDLIISIQSIRSNVEFTISDNKISLISENENDFQVDVYGPTVNNYSLKKRSYISSLDLLFSMTDESVKDMYDEIEYEKNLLDSKFMNDKDVYDRTIELLKNMLSILELGVKLSTTVNSEEESNLKIDKAKIDLEIAKIRKEMESGKTDTDIISSAFKLLKTFI